MDDVTPKKGQAGRPAKEIDWEYFRDLCELQCTQSEIASYLRIHVDTLRDRVLAEFDEDYSTIYKKFSEAGKCSLRRNQFVLSKTNAAMAIWLGKQWLGQRDVVLDAVLPDDILNSFYGLMKQITELQSARRIADSRINKDAKSA